MKNIVLILVMIILFGCHTPPDIGIIVKAEDNGSGITCYAMRKFGWTDSFKEIELPPNKNSILETLLVLSR
jgi:hypothetical protein